VTVPLWEANLKAPTRNFFTVQRDVREGKCRC